MSGMGQPGQGGGMSTGNFGTPGTTPGGPGGPGGAAGSPGMDQMGTPIPLGAGQLPPDILTGVMSVGQQIAQNIDGIAQIVPELGQDFQAIKQLLMQTLSKLLVSGGGPTTPTAPGMGAFPGVSPDRGALPTAPPRA